LDDGQSGLVEVAQGFQLSYLLPDFFPHTTSRNCTVAAAFDDLMIAPYYMGNVVLNFRTFPIRIHDKIYQRESRRLTWNEVLEVTGEHCPSEDQLKLAGIEILGGTSGPGYSDQHETSWEEITKSSGSKEPILELTSVTQLPRRVFSFSRDNLRDAKRHNR